MIPKVLVVIITLIVAMTPFTAAKSVFSSTNTSNKPQDVLILLDNTAETPIKAAKVLDGLVNTYVAVTYREIESWDGLKATVRNLLPQTLVVYAFHGTNEGLTIGAATYSWERMATDVVYPSNAMYHAFLTCHSNQLPTIATKAVITQEGQVDYVVAVLKVGYFIANCMNAKLLADDLLTKMTNEQVGLLARLFLAPESMWGANVHNFTTATALEQIWKLNWIETSLGKSQIIISNVNQTFKNPDNEGLAAQGGRNILKQVNLLIQALSGTNQPLQDTLTQTLWHVSFGTDIDINVKVPSWYATHKNWGSDPTLTALDTATTGELDGQITLKTTTGGTSINQIGQCFTEACKFQPSASGIDTRFTSTGTPISHIWARWLSRSAHFMQDIQNPFHTSLVNAKNEPVECLAVKDLQFDAWNEFKEICRANSISEDMAAYIYENKLEELYNSNYDSTKVYAVVENVPWAIIISTFALLYVSGALIYLGVGSWFAIPVAVVVAIIGVLTMYRIIADRLTNSLITYQNKVNTFAAAKKAYVTDLNTSLTKYSNEHDKFESRIDQIMAKTLNPAYNAFTSWDTQLSTDLQTYINSNRQQLEAQAADFASSDTKRTTILTSWNKASVGDIEDLYTAAQKGALGYADVDEIAFERLKAALRQTTTLWYAYFYSMGMKDSDGDNFSDYIEKKFFGTEENWNGHSLMPLRPVRSTQTSSTYCVTVNAESGIPCQRINVQINYGGYMLSQRVTGQLNYPDFAGHSLNMPFNVYYGKILLEYIMITVTFYDYGQLNSNYQPILAGTTIVQSETYYFRIEDPIIPIYER